MCSRAFYKIPVGNILFTLCATIFNAKKIRKFPKLHTTPKKKKKMNDDGWEYPTHASYQAFMVDLMEFFHGGMEYPSESVFTREELLELGPLDIKRWLANKAYGDPDYNIHKGDRPIFCRSSTIEFAKKPSAFSCPIVCLHG